MREHSHRQQYLTGTAAGYTCLALSLLAYLMETPFVKAGWIPARTPTAVVAIGMAILFLFPASLAHARMLADRGGAEAEHAPEPLSARPVVIRTVLLTVAIGLVVEVFAVGSEAIEYVVEHGSR